VVLAVVCTTGIATKGISMEDRAAAWINDLCHTVDLDLHPGVLRAELGQLTHRPADHLGAVAVCLGGGLR